ncbi:MAG: type II secretion system F family protein [Firmicutes bacterium]|nr:type II secretion system F family protein [Bacillota bacterium]
MTGGFILFGIVGWLFYHHWLGTAISALLAVPFQGIYVSWKLQEQRRCGYQELRDLLYVLSSSFAAGRGLKEGVKDGLRTLQSSYGKESLLLLELEYMYRSMDAGKVSESGALKEFAKRTGFPELDQLAVIYGLCLQTGGNLPQAMTETSDSMLRRLQLWEDIQAKTSRKRLEFLMMTAMVPMLLASVSVSSDYLDPMYQTNTGRIFMTGSLLGLVISAVWASSIVERGNR